MEKLKFKSEKINKKWLYIDHKTEKIVFECDAQDITDADKKYHEATGNNPEGQVYIGCTREDWITPNLLEKYKST